MYNAVSIALTSRIFSAKVKDLRASCYYHVSDWHDSYVLNQAVLLDEEKTFSYNLIKDLDGKLNYAKNITPSNESLLDFYKKSVYDYLSDQYSITLQEIDTSNIEFYIEVTNSDVVISNSVKIIQDNTVAQDVVEIPTSYTLYRVDQNSIQTPLYAYTNAPSAQFKIPGGFGAYVIRERVYKSSLTTQDGLSSRISSRNIYQSYPFKFSIFNSYVQSTESPTSFSANWSAEITATYDAVLKRQEFFRVAPKAIEGSGENVPDQPEKWSDTRTDRDIQPDPSQTEVYAANDDRLNGQYRINGTRHYVYTRDLNNGNTFKNYKVGQTGMLPEYIAYIQITLREAKLLNSALADCPLTRVYDTATANAVLKFQQVYKARVKDGIVDSETKSLFAREVWKKMLQTDNTRYQAVVARIKESNNANCIKFIENAATTVEIWELKNTDLDFQKIGYTGSALGDPISDTIYVAVPARYRSSSVKDVKIESINVYPGSFRGAPSYKGISIQEVRGYAFDINTQTANYSKSQLFKAQTDYSTIFHGVSVNKTLAESGVFSIKLKGSLLGGVFGPAEGYAINKITFVISYKLKEGDATTKWVQEYTDEVTGYIPTTVTKPATIKYRISGKVENISANKAEVIDLSGVKSVKFTTEPLSITYPTFSGDAFIDLTTTKIDFSSTEYKPPFAPFSSPTQGATPSYKDESITINLTSSKSISINPTTLSVSNVLSGTKNPVNSSSVVVTTTNNKLFFETSSLNYENSSVIKSSVIELNNYWLLKSDGSLIQKTKNSVSVLDGLLLLCQPSSNSDLIGKPYGISLQSFVSNNSSNSEFNIDYGAFVLQNEVLDNGGFLYGFYDRSRKEFIGTTLYYVDYVSRGPENVYIGVMAVDADGNIGGSDFLGAKTFGKINPPIAPVKIACPIYHANYVPSSKISLSSIPPNLSKLDEWPLYVTSGSFAKDFYIDPEYGYVNWLQKYNGKKLKALYSTLDISNILWSEILGQPYVDVLKEYPLFLSSRKIQLSQVPIASYIEPSVNKLGLLKQYLFIETRESISDQWTLLSSSYLRNINCSTGVVDLTIDLPQDPDLVRVSYAVKSSGIPIKQVNGTGIPLNPFLNQDTVEPEKPLYIYIKPSKIEVQEAIAASSSGQDESVYVWNHVPEYMFNGVIHFTYDNSIFNPYDSVSYDPFALQIGLIHIVKNTPESGINMIDLRVRGGGLKSTYDKSISVESYGSLDIEKIFKETKEAISFWDVYPPDQQAYPKGGFIIIKLPRTVLDNFVNKEDVYSIIRKNITAGVVFKIQDMEGNDWITV